MWNLKDKKTYAIYVKNLNQALKPGVKLKKVHHVIKFEQSCYMKPYIMLNIKKRTATKNEFEKYFLKLMSQAPLERL